MARPGALLDARVLSDALRGPLIPRRTAVAWRLALLADQRRINAYLRLFGAAGLPLVSGGRLAAMDLPPETTLAALRQVRALSDWDLAWTWAAQRLVIALPISACAAAPRLRSPSGTRRWLTTSPASSCSTTCARCAPYAMPARRSTRKPRAATAADVRRVEIWWRTARLPAYLALPEHPPGPAPLVVLLNGSSTSKEETLLWAAPLRARGFAVLALDWPGSGESALTVEPTADCDDLTHGLFAFAELDPALDASRVALLGFSLGGAVAARAAAHDRRVRALVAVTPPYDPRPWFEAHRSPHAPPHRGHRRWHGGSAPAVP